MFKRGFLKYNAQNRLFTACVLSKSHVSFRTQLQISVTYTESVLHGL